MSDEIKEVVARHDATINHVVESVDRLTKVSERQSAKIDDVIEAIGQNAVILEKLANIDTNNKDSINRVHKRIDESFEMIQAKEKLMMEEIKSVSVKANKGGFIYDVMVALAVAVPVFGVLIGGLFWLVEHSGVK